MRVREQLDIAGTRGQRVVDDVGHRCLKRVAEVAQALDEDRCPRRYLLLAHPTASPHGGSMAAAGRSRN